MQQQQSISDQSSLIFNQEDCLCNQTYQVSSQAQNPPRSQENGVEQRYYRSYIPSPPKRQSNQFVQQSFNRDVSSMHTSEYDRFKKDYQYLNQTNKISITRESLSHNNSEKKIRATENSEQIQQVAIASIQVKSSII